MEASLAAMPQPASLPGASLGQLAESYLALADADARLAGAWGARGWVVQRLAAGWLAVAVLRM